MAEITSLLILVLSVILPFAASSHVYFHEPSAILVNQTSDFGFALSYWNKNLIISSPSIDLYGKVYGCPLAGIFNKNLSCSDMDLFNSTTYTREIAEPAQVKDAMLFKILLLTFSYLLLIDVYPDQYFYLGASIAATKDYLITCAPMVTKNVSNPDLDLYPDAVGSCFMHYDNVTIEYNGPDYIFQWSSNVKPDIFQGGIGWNIMADEENELLIVAKTSVWGEIFYTDISQDNLDLKAVILAESISDPDSESAKSSYVDILNMGYGMAKGNFFTEDTVYAFSKQTHLMTNQIAFLEIKEYDGEKYLELIYQDESCDLEFCVYTINDEVVGSMFGYSLSAADLNMDGSSELLVGAPLHSDDYNEVEFGALHIYLGGDKELMNDRSRKRVIFGSKAMGRFGTTIATNDVDGDRIPEVFVSAPYEDSGVVYILSGRELKEELLTPTSSLTIQVSQLQHTQRIVKEGLSQLGFSLLTVPDVDGNACNELAIGAPGASSVLLLRGLQTISVNITYQLKELYVSEKDENCTVKVCIHIDYQTKSNIISGYISGKNYISGNAVVSVPTIDVDLPEKNNHFCENINIGFPVHEKYNYELTTELEIINTKSMESDDFDETWAKFSPYSQTKNSFVIYRTCKGDDCSPDLSLQINWKQVEPAKNTDDSFWYEVGSSKEETIYIEVINKGFEVSDACVMMEISGAPVYKAGKCAPLSTGYECMLPIPFRRIDDAVREKAIFEIIVNMTSLSHADRALIITAQPYDKCNQKVSNYSLVKRVINYSFENVWKLVHLTGKNHSVSLSDMEISEEELKNDEEDIVKDNHQYTISNEGLVLWNNVVAVIEVENKAYITEVNTREKNCKASKDQYVYKFTCALKLPSVTTKKDTVIMVLVGMSKRKVAEELIEGRRINVTSTMKIFMDSAENAEYIQESLVSDIQLIKETTFGSNKNMIILVATILALLLLALLGFCLYKKGFFQRKKKEELNVLRESVRRRSLRLASEKSSRHSQKSPSSTEGDGGIDIEVVEDSPFEEIPVNSKDKTVLIEADVHKEEEKKEEHTKSA